MGAFDDTGTVVVPDPESPEDAAAFRKRWKWEAHEQVILKGTYTTADQESVENASSGMKGTGKQAALDVRLGSSRRRLLEVMILDWTLARNGMKVEVTKEAIGRLPANYRDPILSAIDTIASGMSEDEQQLFTSGANGHTRANSDETSRSLMP